MIPFTDPGEVSLPRCDGLHQPTTSRLALARALALKAVRCAAEDYLSGYDAALEQLHLLMPIATTDIPVGSFADSMDREIESAILDAEATTIGWLLAMVGAEASRLFAERDAWHRQLEAECAQWEAVS